MVEFPFCSRKGVRYLAQWDRLPPILRYILEEASRPRSQRENEAWGALVLGVGSIKDVAEAKQQARQLQRRER